MKRHRVRKLVLLGLVVAMSFGQASADVVTDPTGNVCVGTTATDNPACNLAIANGGTANGQAAAASTTGCAYTPSPVVGNTSVSGTGCANGTIAVSGTGNATATGEAVSGTGNANSNSIAVSGVGCATGNFAVAYDCANGQHTEIRGHGDATAETVAISGTGCATATEIAATVAVSGTSCANARSAAASGLGSANASGIAVSGAGPSCASTASVSGAGNAGMGCPQASAVGVSGTGDADGTTYSFSSKDVVEAAVQTAEQADVLMLEIEGDLADLCDDVFPECPVNSTQSSASSQFRCYLKNVGTVDRQSRIWRTQTAISCDTWMRGLGAGGDLDWYGYYVTGWGIANDARPGNRTGSGTTYRCGTSNAGDPRTCRGSWNLEGQYFLQTPSGYRFTSKPSICWWYQYPTAVWCDWTRKIRV